MHALKRAISEFYFNRKEVLGNDVEDIRGQKRGKDVICSLPTTVEGEF